MTSHNTEKQIMDIQRTDADRNNGLQRLTYEDIRVANQHYIGTYFIVNDIRDAIAEYARGNILDIGCGNKPYEVLFRDKVSRYTGCDIIQSSDNVVDYLCPANDLCFQDSEFDTVFSTQTLEHVADHRGMVAEAFRVLRPGGYAIFTVPFSWELHEEPYDFFRVSKYGLKYLFEGSGFEVIRIKANGGKWAAISQLFLNVLMSTRKYVTFRSRLIKLLFIRMRLIIPYNKISIWLDKRFFDDVFTLNYIIVARKHN
jgi:SAM-dependent methyltransferase